MTVYRTYNTYTLLTTVLVLVLSVLACSLPVPTTPAAAVVKIVTTPSKSVVNPTTTPKTPDNTLTTARVTAQSLHVRTAPYAPARGMYGTVAGYVYHDDTVTLTNKCSYGWAQIVWEDGTGWVNSRFLSKNNCQTKEGEQ